MDGFLPMTTPTFHFPPRKTPPHVKVCGLKRLEDIRLAHELGASFFGLIFARVSKRRLGKGEASRLIAEARSVINPTLPFIGVFMDEEPDEVAALYHDLDLAAVQIHGPVDAISDVLPDACVLPALGISSQGDGDRIDRLQGGYPAILADASIKGQSGGTGHLFDHRIVMPYFERRRIFLAGGLRPDNIGEVVKRLSPGPLPYAFDLSSGVESEPGIKSPEKLRDFFARYKEAFSAGRHDREHP